MENLENESLEFEKIFSEIEKDCRWPYHNAQHTRKVIERAETFGNYLISPLSDSEKQLLLRAALYHDYGHPGKTIRQLVAQDIPRRDLSNEEYAAEIAAERFRGSEEDREKLRQLILATSFGQDDPKSPFYRDYRPRTRLEKVLALADIGGFTEGFENWIEEGLRVLQEAEKDKIPPDFETWKKGRLAFIGHIRAKVDDLEADLDPEEILKLREELNELTSAVNKKLDIFRAQFESIKHEKMSE